MDLSSFGDASYCWNKFVKDHLLLDICWYVQAGYSLHGVTQLSLGVGWDTTEYRTFVSVRKLCSFPWDNSLISFLVFPMLFVNVYGRVLGWRKHVPVWYSGTLSKTQPVISVEAHTLSSWCGHTTFCPESTSPLLSSCPRAPLLT